MTVRSSLSSLCLALSLSACGQFVQEPPVGRPEPLSGCAALGESACNAAPGCVAIYGEEDAPQPVPRVAVAAGCMPFEPEQPLPYHHCEQVAPADPCAGLDEATCSATPGCAVVESMPGVSAELDGEVVAVAPARTGCVQVGVVPEPLPVDPPVWGGAVCPAMACLVYCEQGEVLDVNGCPTCECLP